MLNLTTLFTRLGHIQGAIDEANTFRGTTLASRTATLAADYASSDENLGANLYTLLAASQGSLASTQTGYAQLAKSVLLQMAAEAQSIQSTTVNAAIASIVAQMQAAPSTIKACAVGSTVTAGGANVGNPVVLVSTKLGVGLVAENAFAETLTLTCTSDAASGSATKNRERLSLTGQPSIADRLSWLWPAGSGARVGLSAIDAGQYQAGRTANALNNGDFESTWTANVPAGWAVGAAGTPGTTILQSTAQHYDGANSLQFAGNGTENTALYQAFGATSGTTVTLSPYTQYAVNLWAKTDATPGAGVLRVALTDGSGTVTTDAQGNANSFNVALTTLGTAWTPINGFFRLGRTLPATGLRLELKLTTPLPNGVNLFLDRAAFAQPTSAYLQGPSVAVFSANTPLILNDTFALSITNDYGGKLQRMMDRLFNMRQAGQILPSTSGSPTYGDGLIA